MIIRRATEKDIDFLIDAIIEAEKSNTDILSYSTLFEFTEEEVRLKLKEMLEEDIPGQELCISGFLIAEIDKTPVGASCSWIEGEDGNVSKINKANLLVWFFGKEKCEKAARSFPFLRDLNFDREVGTLQLEAVYTKAEFRRKGIVWQLFSEHVRMHKTRVPELKKVQLIVAYTNEGAVRAYEKHGFRTIAVKQTQHKEANIFLPSDKRIQMELNIHDISKQ